MTSHFFKRFFIASLLVFILLPGFDTSRAADWSFKLNKARALFHEFVRRENNYDKTLAGLYDPTARIEVETNIGGSGGPSKASEVDAQQYKRLLPMTLKVAERLGDQGDYTDIRYQEEGEMVRITANRSSKRTPLKYVYSLQVGPNAKGHWVIFEQKTHILGK